MTIKLYGLKNCDGCRKALKTLAARGDAVEFHDIREPANTEKVVNWIGATDDPLRFVNKRSTTWRALSNNDKESLDALTALPLLLKNPTLIKRPVLRIGEQTLAGFDAARIDAAKLK
ncbi:MAG: ArsC/Spx/MgsR family protein [Gammaproteobacteria bacterium]